jgi:regulator of sirC expression with transglutaminase-like and TPR domain
MVASSEINALIKLLDDEDQEVLTAVSNSILSHGLSIVPTLEKYWESTLDEKLQQRIEDLIQEIHFRQVSSQLKIWVDTGSSDLLEGAYIIAKYQYPELSLDYLKGIIDDLKQDIWLELSPNLTALEKINVVNHFLFKVFKFTGNTESFFSPQNSYINQVLETKKGNIISLAIVYLLLSNAAGVPMAGVNLPKIFLLAYMDIYDITKKKVLFYVNPYSNGTVLGKAEIDHFLKQQNIESTESYFIPCSNLEIIQRLILNLILAYEKTGQQDKTDELQNLLKILSAETDYLA